MTRESMGLRVPLVTLKIRLLGPLHTRIQGLADMQDGPESMEQWLQGLLCWDSVFQF